MSTAWGNLHRNMDRSISMKNAAERFERMKTAEPMLRDYVSPRALVDYLSPRAGDLAHKNQVYMALLRVMREHDAAGQLAASLIWLGLWSGLDAIYMECSRRNPDRDEAELCSDFALVFSQQMDTI